ncbi:MAG: YiiX/YebB-like N1pC/P60 family cysteine hydrolase, partial [Myxococcales bacterium]
LVRYAREAWEKTDKAYWKKGVALATKASLNMMRDEAFKAVFPAQKGIAGWMGDTRVKRSGRNLITTAQLETLQKKLEPGDILVERRNWYLSNIGLPGFWPHAELYSGTPAELRAYFDADPEVKAVWPEGFTRHLEKSWPEAWAKLALNGHDGEPHRIVEAISEGVVFSTLSEAALADYIGVLRPKLTKVEKARAIARAFAHHGKPYDFDFDFLTDATLVCSELVFKAFQAPKNEGRSLHVPLVRVAGRTTLPANEFVKRFDLDYGTDRQQLEFVAFLDGREGEGRAVDGTLEEFRASHRRMKWDIAQR